jgi:hypothetical protein
MTPMQVESVVNRVARTLVRHQRIAGASYLNLPILYPDGLAVTVKIDPIA